MNSRGLAALALAVLVSVVAVRPATAELIYGIANQAPATALVTWDSATPNDLQSGVFLTGLQQNETILGIDFRPATGELYGLGSSSRLYVINPTTGLATAVGGGPFTPQLNGFNFAFDFNPTIDRIRVVSEANQNLVLNPNGTVQTVAPAVNYPGLNPPAGTDPNIVHVAYTNNFPGAGSTTLYSIDSGLDTLNTQVAATGVLTRVGSLGIDVSSAGGFDISGVTGTAYATMLLNGASQSTFYSVNLGTGATTNLGAIDGGLVITAMTIAPVPEPATCALFGLALTAFAFVRRGR
jgi:hypothetical protein